MLLLRRKSFHGKHLTDVHIPLSFLNIPLTEPYLGDRIKPLTVFHPHLPVHPTSRGPALRPSRRPTSLLCGDQYFSSENVFVCCLSNFYLDRSTNVNSRKIIKDVMGLQIQLVIQYPGTTILDTLSTHIEILKEIL